MIAPVADAGPTGVGSPPVSTRTRALFGQFAQTLFAPRRVFAKSRDGIDAGLLLLILLAFDFVLALILLPHFIGTLRAVFAAHPEMTASARAASVGTTLIIATSVNVLLILLITVLVMTALLVLDRRVKFAELFAGIVYATTPLMIDRAVRVVLLVAGGASSNLANPLPLSMLFPSAVGTIHKALSYFGLFDVWAAVLVFLAVEKVAQAGRGRALLLTLIFWGGLQATLLQLHLHGIAG